MPPAPGRFSTTMFAPSDPRGVANERVRMSLEAPGGTPTKRSVLSCAARKTSPTSATRGRKPTRCAEDARWQRPFDRAAEVHVAAGLSVACRCIRARHRVVTEVAVSLGHPREADTSRALRLGGWLGGAPAPAGCARLRRSSLKTDCDGEAAALGAVRHDQMEQHGKALAASATCWGRGADADLAAPRAGAERRRVVPGLVAFADGGGQGRTSTRCRRMASRRLRDTLQ